MFFSRKYKRHCIKVQALADNRGNIVWIGDRIWPGSMHDLSIYVEQHPNLLNGEHVLADKAYCGIRGRNLGLKTPFKRPRGGNLTQEQLDFNYVHSYHRITVEHSFGYLKRFKISSSVYRGRLGDSMGEECLLYKIVVLCNLSYLYTSRNPLRIA